MFYIFTRCVLLLNENCNVYETVLIECISVTVTYNRMAFQIHQDSTQKAVLTNKFGFNKKDNSKIVKLQIKRAPLQPSNFCGKNIAKNVKSKPFKKTEPEIQIYNDPPIKNEIKENKVKQNDKNEFKEIKVIKEFKVLDIADIPSFNQCNQVINDKENNGIQEDQHTFYFGADHYFLITSEYHDSIYAYLLKLERKLRRPKVDYMTKQPELSFNMRSILVDWLAAVSDEYNMQPQTFHLAVQYIDCFLSRMSVIKSKFQLVGTAAMMIAAKYEEIYPPDTKEWAYLTADAFTSKQLIKMEQLILRVLNFELVQPTPCTFIAHICYVCNLPKKVMMLALYLSELTLLEGNDYFAYFPSQLAFAAVALARHTFDEKELWPEYFEIKTGYSLKQLNPLIKKQHKSFKDSPTKVQQAIQDKFKTVRFGRVSLFKPKDLDLNDAEE